MAITKQSEKKLLDRIAGSRVGSDFMESRLKTMEINYDPRDPNGPGLDAPVGTMVVLGPDAILPDGRVNSGGSIHPQVLVKAHPASPYSWRYIQSFGTPAQTYEMSNMVVLLDHTAVSPVFSGFVNLNAASPNLVYDNGSGIGKGTQVFDIEVKAIGLQKADTGAATPEGTPNKDSWVMRSNFLVRYDPTSEGGPNVDTANYDVVVAEMGPSVDGVIGGAAPSIGWVGIVLGGGTLPIFGYFVSNGDDNGGGDTGRTILWRFNVKVSVAFSTDNTFSELDFY